MKGREEASERMLKEKEASQLSDNEFKAMVMSKLNEFPENYQNYKEITMNSMQRISQWERK